MKKETIKVVEKFYSEISLELVNMWENYLKKYSSLDENIEQLG
jgi:archaellum component FlaC